MSGADEHAAWRQRELLLLRRIARLAGALLQEESDPAMSGARVELRETLAELQAWKVAGRARGWGC